MLYSVMYTHTLALFGLDVVLCHEQQESAIHWDNCLSHCIWRGEEWLNVDLCGGIAFREKVEHTSLWCSCWIFQVLGPWVDDEWVNFMLVLSSAHNKHVKKLTTIYGFPTTRYPRSVWMYDSPIVPAMQIAVLQHEWVLAVVWMSYKIIPLALHVLKCILGVWRVGCYQHISLVKNLSQFIWIHRMILEFNDILILNFETHSVMILLPGKKCNC